MTEAYDETNITDIELLPDGRICVFGASLEVLEILESIDGNNPEFTTRLATLRQALEANHHIDINRSKPSPSN